MPFVKDLFLRVAIGDKTIFPRNNVSKCGNIICAAPDRATAVEAAENAVRSIFIRLDPNNPETGDFLSISPNSPNEGCTFPPNAFQLTPELKDELSKLPETYISFNLSASVPPCEYLLIPFPAFTESGLKDYVGRTVAESLRAVQEIAGVSLQEISINCIEKYYVECEESSDNVSSFLGRQFWSSLVRGGYQGAIYYLDKLITRK
jgi:hypothetical protein